MGGDEIRNSRGEHLGFARPSAGENHEWTIRDQDGLALLFIQPLQKLRDIHLSRLKSRVMRAKDLLRCELLESNPDPLDPGAESKSIMSTPVMLRFTLLVGRAQDYKASDRRATSRS